MVSKPMAYKIIFEKCSVKHPTMMKEYNKEIDDYLLKMSNFELMLYPRLQSIQTQHIQRQYYRYEIDGKDGCDAFLKSLISIRSQSSEKLLHIFNPTF